MNMFKKIKTLSVGFLTAFLAAGYSALAHAADAVPTPPPAVLDTGHNAWMLTSTALVLMMTIPGLALFYGGLVRKKNVLSVLAQSFTITCLVTVLWFVVGYSLSFKGEGAYIGDLSAVLLHGVTVNSLAATTGQSYPELTFMMFQMTFAIITPALIMGSVAERMKFSAMLWFIALWSLVVYSPIAHMVWAPTGYFAKLGALDYAGGTVVHINSGIAALVACLMIGKRVGYKVENMAPHNLVLTVIGASMLWVGWFGFNAGSAYAADGRAAMAMTVTQIATAAAALAWMFAEWIIHKKPSVLGVASGAVAGLVAITPASGYVDPTGSFFIGIAGGIICFFAATSLKKMLGYDDALDVFGVHCVGGITGALLTGVFATKAVMGGDAPMGLLEGNTGQLAIQGMAVLTTLIYSGVATAIILKVIDVVIGIRVETDAEREGLDIRLHGESIA
jgi:Amt family ammonium transporter